MPLIAAERTLSSRNASAIAPCTMAVMVEVAVDEDEPQIRLEASREEADAKRPVCRLEYVIFARCEADEIMTDWAVG